MLYRRIAKVIIYNKKKYLAIWIEEKSSYFFKEDDLLNDFNEGSILRVYFKNNDILLFYPTPENMPNNFIKIL